MLEYFKINNHFKKYLPIFMIMLSIVLLMGTSYALLRSSQQGEETYVMNVGLLEVTFQDSETNALTVENMVPVSDEEGMETDKELVFTVKNTGTLPAMYNIYIEETSTNPEFKTVIRFISNKDDTGYNDPKTLSESNFIDQFAYLDVGESATYKVKVWLDEQADSTYMDKTFTARIVVDVMQNRIKNFVSAVKDKYGTDTTLIAVNTDGDLYDSSNQDQEVREYRYSGPTANNYVFFDTNGDGVKDTNEIWRVVGVFKDTVKDEDGNVVNDSQGNPTYEDEVKLVRNTLLTADELPESYLINGTTYTIASGTTSNYAYWNSTKVGTNYNDWTTAGLQYYLNTEKDETDTSDGTTTANAGYLSLLTNEAKELISPTTYYLGNVDYNVSTVKLSYSQERDATRLWSGNQATWDGLIGMMYPSDYGYSASDLYWETDMYGWSSAESDGVIARSTSWLYQTANHSTYEWLLSPSSYNSRSAMLWTSTGYVNDYSVYDHYYSVRPVLNLKSGAKVIDGAGTLEEPFVIVTE